MYSAVPTPMLSSVLRRQMCSAATAAAQMRAVALPYLLRFAAGAMLYVVAEEQIPEMAREKDKNRGAIFFAAGFSIMMMLDVALGT